MSVTDITSSQQGCQTKWGGTVIVISGAPVEAGHEVCEMLEITAILRKPFEMSSLLAAIAAALNRHTQDSFQERT